jgi:hexosaminidase
MNIRNIFSAAVLTVAFSGICFGGGPENVIPRPAEYTVSEGTFTPQRDKDIKISKSVKVPSGLEDFQKEAYYTISVTKKGVKIASNTDRGIFYAMQTLRQMEADGQPLECCEISDYPRFEHRGLMIDESRNFKGKDWILKQLDVMASLKMSSLHLHLVDDAGWRVEIESYPKLNTIASWRQGKTWKDWRYGGQNYAVEGSPLAEGGYLTKADIREIVDYASERYINVIPEIEMPGHSRELCAAYPEVSCLDSAGAHHVLSSDVCPASDSTYIVLEAVLDEIMDMFPSKYIHVGGDEAGMRSWKKCPKCQALMKKEGFADVYELQNLLEDRIAAYLKSKGRVMVGWDEIVRDENLDKDVVVMSWRGTTNGIKAIGQGHRVIMCPTSYCYLDYYQDVSLKEPEAIGGYVPLSKTYSYDPMDGVPESGEKLLAGVQGNLWCEFIPTGEHAEYMLYPRALAIAEVGWTSPSRKDYADFRLRTIAFTDRLKAEGYNSFDLRSEAGDRPESVSPVNHLALGKSVEYTSKWSKAYPAAGEATLTDGLRGTWTYLDGRWMGFLKPIDVTVDLGSETEIHYLSTTFMSQPGNGVGFPEAVEFWVSDDGKEFSLASKVVRETANPGPRAVSFVNYGAPVEIKARYVKVKVSQNSDSRQPWLFLDEIIVK